MDAESIGKVIIEMKNDDLKLREKLIQEGELDQGYHPQMAELHNRNAQRLNELIDIIGYPNIDRVGKEASEAAWLIIQHAIGQPAFMKKCAVLLEKAVCENGASPINYAYLSDRIAVFEGQPQLYGTQFDWDENGLLVPNPVDDIANVNARRKSIGLNTLEEQTMLMQEQAKRENRSAPPDRKSRQKEYEAWRREVGWIK